MILDEQGLFSDNQTITANTASTNIINTNGDIGKGTPVNLLIQVTDDFAGLTNLKVSVQTFDTEDFTTPVTLIEANEAAENLKKGYKFPINVLPTGIKKYLRLYYTVTGTGTAGKITAGIVDGLQESYND